MNKDRPIVRVTHDDCTAALQIIACIARPKRPASAGELMQQWFWARKRYRREGLPECLEIKIPDKNKITAKLPALRKDILNAWESGRWLLRRCAADCGGEVADRYGASFRQLGAKHWNDTHRRGITKGDLSEASSSRDESAVAKQIIWTKRRPVAHMALAVLSTMRQELDTLEELTFDTSWVSEALDVAEVWADNAISLGILKPEEPWRFLR
jgi:hypothetical protein